MALDWDNSKCIFCGHSPMEHMVFFASSTERFKFQEALFEDDVDAKGWYCNPAAE